MSKAPTRDDPDPKIELHQRGKNRFVLEGRTCGEWVEIDEPVENRQ